MCDQLGLTGKEISPLIAANSPPTPPKSEAAATMNSKKHKKVGRAVQRMLKKHKAMNDQEKNSGRNFQLMKSVWST